MNAGALGDLNEKAAASAAAFVWSDVAREEPQRFGIAAASCSSSAASKAKPKDIQQDLELPNF